MAKGIEEDVVVLARHLILAEEVRSIEERSFGYPSERKATREKAMQAYMAHLPAVREILTREKR
jgi:hypothetical protein